MIFDLPVPDAQGTKSLVECIEGRRGDDSRYKPMESHCE